MNLYLYKAKTSSMVCEIAYLNIFDMAKYSKNISSIQFPIQGFLFFFSLSWKSVLGPLKKYHKSYASINYILKILKISIIVVGTRQHIIKL